MYPPGSKRKTHWAKCVLSFGGPPPHSVYLGRHWCHSHDKWYQPFPLHICILQAMRNWTVGRPGNEVTSVYKPCQMSWHLKHIRMIAVYELTNNTNCETNQLWVSVCMLVLFSVSHYPFIASCSEVWHSPKLYPAWMHLTKWNSIGNSGILDFTIGLLWLPSLELSTNFSTLLLVEGEG